MTVAKSFLEHVLPDEGWLCATVITETRRYNKFFDTFDALTSFILTTDAAGSTVYHACASFKTKENRKQINVKALRSLFFELDAGPGKPYADAQSAWQALNSWCQSTAVPMPTVVGSGYGIHCYLPLVEELDFETWRSYAKGLAKLFADHGLQVDPARTCDGSSILRTPGTHNRKHGEKLVECGELTGPYLLEELNVEPLLGLRRATAKASPGMRSLLAAAQIRDDYPPSDPHLIAGQCKQLGRFVAERGNIPEPDWYAGIGVFAFCKNDEFIHQASAGHPTYSFDETQGRIERAREFGPTTCAYFEQVNPSGCEGCEHRGKITSPIQLGRFQSVVSRTSVPAVLEPVQLLPSSLSFACSASGLYHISEDKQGQPVKTLISAAPIGLMGVQTGELARDVFSVAFEIKLPHETHTAVLPTKTFFSNSGIPEICGKGAIIHNHDLFKQYVREAMDEWHRNNKTQTRYEQFGWKDNDTSFLCGTRLYRSTGVETVIGSDEVMRRSAYLGPKKRGSLAKWSAAANALFTRGLEPHAFTLLGAFAAPIMPFHTRSEGGAIISLVSDDTSKGKSTALEGGFTVWGEKRGIEIKDDDTKISRGVKLGVLGNLPCTYDELYTRDPEVIRNFVMMFSNGSDRERASASGGLIHNKADWQTLMLMASNLSLVDSLGVKNEEDAAQYRIIELRTDASEFKLPKSKADELKRELEENAGWAGDAYLQTLVQPEIVAHIKKNLPRYTETIYRRANFDNKHRFWVRAIASIGIAGMICTQKKILEFDVDRIIDYALEFLQREVIGSNTRKRLPHGILARFLDDTIKQTLIVDKPFMPRQPQMVIRPPTDKLWVRIEREKGRAFILESALREWLNKNMIGRSFFLEGLKKENILVHPCKRITLGAGTDYASGQITAVEVNLDSPLMREYLMEVGKTITPDYEKSPRGKYVLHPPSKP